MSANRSRKGGAASGPMVGLLLGIVLAIVGVVFLVQGLRAANEGYPMAAFGIEVQSAAPGVILLVLSGIVAIGSLVALSGGGRTRRTFASEVVSWTSMPPTGVKVLGNPPSLPSHRAELAAQGIEAFRLSSGEWAVRRIVR